mgnify:FL=1
MTVIHRYAWTRKERHAIYLRLVAEHRTKLPVGAVRTIKGTFGDILIDEAPAPEYVVRVLHAALRVSAFEPDGGETLARRAVAYLLEASEEHRNLRALSITMLIGHARHAEAAAALRTYLESKSAP